MKIFTQCHLQLLCDFFLYYIAFGLGKCFAGLTHSLVIWPDRYDPTYW